MDSKANQLEKLYHQLSRPPIDKSVYDLIISEDKENIKYATNYQRNFIWKNKACTNLIETILIHGIIPPLIALETDEGIEIIEGRQRYETLLNFYHNKFKLKANGLQKLKKLEGKCYKDLSESAQTIFQDYKIKIALYSAKDRPDITEEDLNLFRHDAYERFKLGTTPLSKSDVARAKYQFDDLTMKFANLFKEDEIFFNQCVEVFLPKRKQELEDRERLNLVLVAIREILIMQYIPIIDEKTIKFGTMVVDDYYQHFIVSLGEDEKVNQMKKFKYIFKKIYELKQKLEETNKKLKDSVLLYKTVYWMLSILYDKFSDDCYQFNVSQFYRYLQKDAEKYFDIYKSVTTDHIKARHSYIYRYMKEELELNIDTYLEKIKENKKIFQYKMSKDDEENAWNEMGADRQAVPSTATMSVSEVIRLIKKEQLIVQPSFQRAELKHIEKASRIIESILLGVKLPPIYIYAHRGKDGIEKYTVLDRSTANNKYFTFYG